jgi:hypothetical protein
VSSVAHQALRCHRLLPPRIALQPSHFPACISRPLGYRICSTALLVCPVSLAATASLSTVGGSCRTSHAIGHTPAWSSAIKQSRKAYTSREYRPCERPFPPTARPPYRPPHAGPPSALSASQAARRVPQTAGGRVLDVEMDGSVTQRLMCLPVESTEECKTRGEGAPWAARLERDAERARRW